MVTQAAETGLGKTDFKAEEARFRGQLVKLLAAFSITFASLLSFLLVPIFPGGLSVFLAACFGAIAYVAPLLGAVLMFVCTVLGYVYQATMPPAVALAILVLLLVIALGTTNPGSIIGVACGLSASVLLTTNFYFLAIPLMITLPLIHARGKNIGSTSAILVFLALSLPLLVRSTPAAIDSQGHALQLLFGQTQITHAPPLGFVDINSLIAKVNSGLLWDPDAAAAYYRTMSVYFPAFAPGAEMNILIILLGAYLGAAIGAAFGILKLFRWLETRQEDSQIYRLIAPVSAVVGAEITFLIAFNAMSPAFGYQPRAQVSLIAGLFFAALIFGGLGSAIQRWLVERDTLVVLRQDYVAMLPEARQVTEALSQQCLQTKAVCPTMDLVTEELVAKKVKQELLIATTSPAHMSMAALQEKVGQLGQDEKEIRRTSADLVAKLRQYCADNSQRYRDLRQLFSGFGVDLGEPAAEVPMSTLSQYDFERLLTEARLVNKLYQSAAEVAVQQAEGLQKGITTELDSGWKSSVILISRNYCQQGSYLEALDALQPEYARFEQIVGETTSALLEKYAANLTALGRALRETVIPAMDAIGDSEAVSRYTGLAAELDGIAQDPKSRLRPSDVMPWIDKTHRLASIVHTIISDLLNRLTDLEKDIEERVPIGYNWSKNTVAQEELGQFLRACAANGKAPTLVNSTRLNEKAVRLLESASASITEYSHIREFLINYVNIEFLIEQKLEARGEAREADIPVKRQYAQQYLRLFTENHSSRVYIDGGTGNVVQRKSA